MSFAVEPAPKRQKTIESDLETEYYLSATDAADCMKRVVGALSSETPNYDILRTTDCHGRLPHHLLFSHLMDNLCDNQDYIKAFSACYEHFPEGGHTQDKSGFVPLDYFVSGMLDRDSDEATYMVDDLLHNPLKEHALLNVAKAALQANPEAIFSSGLFEMVASELDPAKCENLDDDGDERQLLEDDQTMAIETLLDLTFVDATTAEQEATRRNPLHMVATHSWVKYAEKLLPRFLSTDSAQIMNPTTQQLPLHMAVSSCGVESQGHRHVYNNVEGQQAPQIKLDDENRLTIDIGVVERLVDTFPVALGRKDDSGRVPFVLACCNQCSVAVLFHLLRAKPDELAHFL